MDIIFIVLSIIGICYFIFKNRGFDLLSLSYFSAIIYFLPFYYGYIYEPAIVNGKYYFERNDLDSRVYIVGLIVLSSIIIAAYIFDSSVNLDEKLKIDLKINNIFLGYYTFFLWLAIFYLLIQNGGSLFTGKIDVLSKSHIASIFLRSSTVYFTVAMLSKKKLFIINALTIYSICFLIGIRSFIAIGLLSYILVLLLNKNGSLVRLLNIKLISVIIFLSYIMINGKYIYSTFHLLGFNGLLSSVIDYKATLSNIQASEPFAIQMILNKTIQSNFHTGAVVLRDSFLDFFYLDKLLNIETFNFNKEFTSVYFGFVDYGLAYNIWAEAYSIGNYFYVVCFVIAFNLVISFFNFFLKKYECLELQGLLSVIGVFTAFYIHRNSLSNILTINKTLFMSVCIIFMLSILTKIILTSNTKFIVITRNINKRG